MSLFPITVTAYETPHFTSSPYRYRSAFLRALDAYRATHPKATWYAYDAVLHSRTDIEFVVYDMRDNLSGGIGKEQFRLRESVAAEITQEDVEEAIYRQAEAQRAQELHAAEQAIIDGYANAIREELDK